jgi:hypothetical protein
MERVSKNKLAPSKFAAVACNMQGQEPREYSGMRQDASARVLQRPANAAMQAPLRALALELSAVQETALDLQISISSILASLGDTSCDAVFSLQDLDRLTQILGDLSIFTQVLAVSSPETWHVDVYSAAERLNLRDLAHRLCGDEVIPADSLAAAGGDSDCTFF